MSQQYKGMQIKTYTVDLRRWPLVFLGFSLVFFPLPISCFFRSNCSIAFILSSSNDFSFSASAALASASDNLLFTSIAFWRSVGAGALAGGACLAGGLGALPLAAALSPTAKESTPASNASTSAAASPTGPLSTSFSSFSAF